jgi:hypothetical protein
VVQLEDGQDAITGCEVIGWLVMVMGLLEQHVQIGWQPLGGVNGGSSFGLPCGDGPSRKRD